MSMLIICLLFCRFLGGLSKPSAGFVCSSLSFGSFGVYGFITLREYLAVTFSTSSPALGVCLHVRLPDVPQAADVLFWCFQVFKIFCLCFILDSFLQ